MPATCCRLRRPTATHQDVSPTPTPTPTPTATATPTTSAAAYPHADTAARRHPDTNAYVNTGGASPQSLDAHARPDRGQRWHWRLHHYRKRSQTCASPGHRTFVDPFGIPDVLADPVLELHGPAVLSPITNDNWQDDPRRRRSSSPRVSRRPMIWNQPSMRHWIPAPIRRSFEAKTTPPASRWWKFTISADAGIQNWPTSAPAPLSIPLTTLSSRVSFWAATAAMTGSWCAGSDRA